MTESLTARRSTNDAELASREQADELVAFAKSLRDELRSRQEEHETLGGYAEDVHERFLAAGLYRILQPKRYGGLELGLDAFLRVAIEIGRGDPGVGWAFTLAAGHAFHLASFYPDEAQREIFADTDFVAPSRTIPMGKARKVDGGYRVDGKWDYLSGSKWSTHAMVVAPTVDEQGASLGLKMFTLRRDQYEILGDWGGDQTIGMRASESNSIQVTDQFVTDLWAIEYGFREHELGEDGPVGYGAHPNPIYVGRTMFFFNAELVSSQIGAAWAALDEYEPALAARPSSFPPRTPRVETPEYHRWFGKALALTDSAESLLLAGGRQYIELAQLWAETGREFTPEEDARLRSVAQQAARLANEAVEILFTTAGSSSARRGSRMQKYYRDVAMYKTHIAAQWDVTYSSLSRYHFGQPLTF